MNDLLQKLNSLSNERKQYLISTLVTHLSDANQYTRMRSLFEDDAWLHVRYSNNNYSYTAYISDLEITWEKLLENTYKDVSLTHLQDALRYALIQSSINSLEASYPPSLVLAGLQLDPDKWTVERVLSLSFSGGYYTVPKIYVHLLTECVLSSEQRKTVYNLISTTQGTDEILIYFKSGLPSHLKTNLLMNAIASKARFIVTARNHGLIIRKLIMSSEWNQEQRKLIVRQLMTILEKPDINKHDRRELMLAVCICLTDADLANTNLWRSIGKEDFMSIFKIVWSVTKERSEEQKEQIFKSVNRYLLTMIDPDYSQFQTEFNTEQSLSASNHFDLFFMYYLFKQDFDDQLTHLNTFTYFDHAPSVARIALEWFLDFQITLWESHNVAIEEAVDEDAKDSLREKITHDSDFNATSILNLSKSLEQKDIMRIFEFISESEAIRPKTHWVYGNLGVQLIERLAEDEQIIALRHLSVGGNPDLVQKPILASVSAMGNAIRTREIIEFPTKMYKGAIHNLLKFYEGELSDKVLLRSVYTAFQFYTDKNAHDKDIIEFLMHHALKNSQVSSASLILDVLFMYVRTTLDRNQLYLPDVNKLNKHLQLLNQMTLSNILPLITRHSTRAHRILVLIAIYDQLQNEADKQFCRNAINEIGLKIPARFFTGFEVDRIYDYLYNHNKLPFLERIYQAHLRGEIDKDKFVINQTYKDRFALEYGIAQQSTIMDHRWRRHLFDQTVMIPRYRFIGFLNQLYQLSITIRYGLVNYFLRYFLGAGLRFLIGRILQYIIAIAFLGFLLTVLSPVFLFLTIYIGVMLIRYIWKNRSEIPRWRKEWFSDGKIPSPEFDGSVDWFWHQRNLNRKDLAKYMVKRNVFSHFHDKKSVHQLLREIYLNWKWVP